MPLSRATGDMKIEKKDPATPARAGRQRSDMTRKRQESSLLTVREVASYLSIHANTVRRWSDLGILEAYRIGPRRDRRFRREDILAFLPRRAHTSRPASRE